MLVPPDIHQATTAYFLSPYLDGHQPHCHTRTIETTGGPNELDPIPTGRITRQHRTRHSRTLVVEGIDHAALINWRSRSVHIVARAATDSIARDTLGRVAGWFPRPENPSDVVPIDFWQTGPRMYTTTRSIESPRWDDVAHHYPGEVGTQLSDLFATQLDRPSGRIILWHGMPGTGKTSAIRAMARAWQDQARLQVVLEPEVVFSNSNGLMQVLLDHKDATDASWRVLVVEDADDLVRAGSRSAPVLSRLLNVGDGLVGQGLRVLVLLTTNEPPGRLHPALSRPGRCLSSIAFRPFNAAEAQQAFPDADSALLRAERTLAELMNGIASTADERTPGNDSAPGYL